MGKNSKNKNRVRLPTPAQLIRSDLECETRTNLPINHCAEMLTRTLRSGAGLEPSLLYMVENSVDIQSGQVIYCSKTGQTLEKIGYQVTIPVAEESNHDQFVTILRNHQAGQTDFPTFCQESAAAGVYKWVIDLETMTCSYVDKAERLVFVETVPSVEK